MLLGSSAYQKKVYRTKSKNTLVRHVRRTADHVARMTFRHLVVADVEPFHASTLEFGQYLSDLLFTRIGLELERKEDMRKVGGVVPVNKLCYGARVYDRV
jgi:hypothetical protein